VHATVQRYNQQGQQALSDRRHTNPGRQPKLRPEETTQVLQALQSPPPDGGLWTGEKLRRWVVLRLGKQLSLNPIYRLLYTAGFRLKVPRPVHRKGDPAAQEAYKKTSAKGSRRRGRRDGRFGSLPMTSTSWD